jgi:hypothetical protein
VSYLNASREGLDLFVVFGLLKQLALSLEVRVIVEDGSREHEYDC